MNQLNLTKINNNKRENDGRQNHYLEKREEKMSIYELENLLTDPDYFIEETFLPLQNEIDIIAEEAKLKRPENAMKSTKKEKNTLKD